MKVLDPIKDNKAMQDLGIAEIHCVGCDAKYSEGYQIVSHYRQIVLCKGCLQNLRKRIPLLTSKSYKRKVVCDSCEAKVKTRTDVIFKLQHEKLCKSCVKRMSEAINPLRILVTMGRDTK